MSASSKINDSPAHFMVLQAIARGLDTIDKIATATRKSKDEVSTIINDLVNQRLATMREKGRFFGSKERKFTITETGSSLLGVKQQELRQSQERLQQVYESGDKAAVAELHGFEQNVDPLHAYVWYNRCVVFCFNFVFYGNGNESIRACLC